MLGALEYVRYAATLFFILDPFAAIPIFLLLTAGREADRPVIARTAAVAVFAVLATAALSGDVVLRFVGASLPAFQVGGGIVLLLMALSLVNAQLSPQQHRPEETAEAGDRAVVGVVPIAIPLLVGPGSISATIIQMQQGVGLAHAVLVLLAVAAVGGSVWLILNLAGPIGRRLGRTGLNILNRIFGLLLAAVAIQIFADGLKGLFPALA
jgi:multiple antibiotic resistance protein